MTPCRLCNKNAADQRNSHIVPKFMGQRLFDSSKAKHSLQIDKKGRIRKIQDTPKDDYLICSNCELRIGLLEALFARKLVAVHDYINQKGKISLTENGKNKILKCHNINPSSFKLFVFSILWRISVCKNEIYQNFVLPKKIESKLRLFIDSNLKNTHKELMDSLPKIRSVPPYHFIVYKPTVKNDKSRGILSAYQISNEIFALFTVDLAIHFYCTENSIDTILRTISNKQNDDVFIALANIHHWKTISRHVVGKLLKEG